jgi:hypothetical protein
MLCSTARDAQTDTKIIGKVTVSIPAPYDYTHMHFPTHLFLYTFRTIPEGAMNASA